VTTLRIGDRVVGDGAPCYVIAEAGSNHDGERDQALRLIDVAADSGADAVKFQSFRARTLYPRSGGPVAYLRELGIDRSIYDIAESLEMPPEWIPDLAARARQRGIDFLSTPFDEAAVDELEPYVPAYKIASYELTHLPLIRHAARKKKPMLISTGGGLMAEIRDAVAAIRAEGNGDIVVMQCTAKYPAPLDDLDLRALPTIRRETGVLVGFSDHSTDPTAGPVVAVANGACVVEKHFTISRALPGPDHSFAIEPAELAAMVAAIRAAERTLGSDAKRVRPVEAELVNYRRSIFTTRAVRAGEIFAPTNVAILRRSGQPDTGLRPGDIDGVLGAAAARDLEADHPLAPDDVAGGPSSRTIRSVERSLT
jgi:sialic acid synthase SpsE